MTTTRNAQITRPAALLATLALSACGMSGDRTDATSRSIFTDPTLLTWELGAEPLLEIGGQDERDGYALGNVVGAVLLREHLVIADRQFVEVRFYSLAGGLTARSGRYGDGPGAYRHLGAIAAYDDTTVVAWDWQLARFTRIAANGTVLATIPADLSGAEDPDPIFLGALGSGHFIFRAKRSTTSPAPEFTGERRDSIRYLILEPNGARPRHTWNEPGAELHFSNETPSGSTPVIFGRSTMATTTGNSIVVGSNDSLRLVLRTRDGSIRRAATLPWTSTPVDDEWVEIERQRRFDAEYEGIFMRFLRQSVPDAHARRLESLESWKQMLPTRRTLPAFSDLRADADGNIWVAQYPPPGASERTWIVLDTRLQPVARIELPLNLEILHLRSDRLVTRTKGELGRQTVAVYPILR